MSEQELRDFLDMEPKLLEYSGEIGSTPIFYAQFAPLDAETVAMRILHDDHETAAYDWRICTYSTAVSILALAESEVSE